MERKREKKKSKGKEKRKTLVEAKNGAFRLSTWATLDKLPDTKKPNLWEQLKEGREAAWSAMPTPTLLPSAQATVLLFCLTMDESSIDEQPESL